MRVPEHSSGFLLGPLLSIPPMTSSIFLLVLAGFRQNSATPSLSDRLFCRLLLLLAARCCLLLLLQTLVSPQGMKWIVHSLRCGPGNGGKGVRLKQNPPGHCVQNKFERTSDVDGLNADCLLPFILPAALPRAIGLPTRSWPWPGPGTSDFLQAPAGAEHMCCAFRPHRQDQWLLRHLEKQRCQQSLRNSCSNADMAQGASFSPDEYFFQADLSPA